jgi:CBS domain-containing protein
MMRARELMTTPVVTAPPEMTVKEAAELMAEHRVSGLPVVDREGRLAGVIAESDLVQRLEPHDPARGVLGLLDRLAHAAGADRRFLARTVAELMTTEVTTAGPEATVRELIHLINTYQINRIPIVEGGRLLGIVTRADILRALTRPDAAITQDVRWRLEHELWIDPRTIDVSTADGVVTLAGEVDTRADAELAARWAGATDGVVAVDSSRLHYRVDDERVKVRTDRLR